jgi:hypothetical protein
MPTRSRMQQLSVVEILDRAMRLYRMNLRVGVLLPGLLVLTIALANLEQLSRLVPNDIYEMSWNRT